MNTPPPAMAHLYFGGTSSNVIAMIAVVLALFATLWLMISAVNWLRSSPWKVRTSMQKIIEDFRATVEKAMVELEEFDESEAGSKPAAAKWSKKEILGHLIDSASNNHQRFVRAQLSAEIKLPGYEQASWVNTQRCATESWATLLQLWEAYNRHLLHLVAAIPESAHHNYCFIGEDEPVTLEFLVGDYVRHLKHHLEQIYE